MKISSYEYNELFEDQMFSMRMTTLEIDIRLYNELEKRAKKENTTKDCVIKRIII